MRWLLAGRDPLVAEMGQAWTSPFSEGGCEALLPAPGDWGLGTCGGLGRAQLEGRMRLRRALPRAVWGASFWERWDCIVGCFKFNAIDFISRVDWVFRNNIVSSWTCTWEYRGKKLRPNPVLVN